MKPFLIFLVTISSLILHARADDRASGDAAIAPTKKMNLFDGEGFSGCIFVSAETSAPTAATWSVANGVINCKGKPNGYAQ